SAYGPVGCADRQEPRTSSPAAPAAADPLVSRGPAPLLAAYRRRGRLLLLDKLQLDGDLDLVTDDKPTVDQHIHGQPEVLAIDLAFGTVRHAMAHPFVVDLAVALDRERDRPGDALDRQIARHAVLVVPGGCD